MGNLEHIISLLNKEEIRHLKLFLNRTNASKERKDIALFDLIRKSPAALDEEKVLKRLYDQPEKNTYYRLRNRLLDEIGKSLLLQYYNTSDSNSVLHFLSLSRHFQQRSQFKPAYYYLNKAEKKALQISGYELLDLIYSDFIRLSQESLSIDPSVYIDKRSTIRKELNQLREIDDVLAKLIYRIKKSQNFASGQEDMVETLQKSIDELSAHPGLKKNTRIRFRIYHALSRIFLQQHNYNAMEAYLLSTLQEFEEESLFTRNNHDTKLQMLTYLVNALFKNGKYEDSLVYAEQLHQSMKAYDRVHYERYQFYYYNALVNNYTLLDKEKAIEILNKVISEPSITSTNPQSRLIFFLNLALLYFDTGKFKKASRSLVKIKLDETFEELDKAFQLKIRMVELIVRFELEDFDFVEYNVNGLKRTFDNLLNKGGYKRQKDMLNLLLKMIYVAPQEYGKELQEDIAVLMSGLSDEEAENSDILSYSGWLRSKTEKGA